MGVLFKNENLSDDMIDVLKKFQSYIPFTMVDGKKSFLTSFVLVISCLLKGQSTASTQCPMGTHQKTA